MVLGNFQCRSVLLIWIIVGQGPVALACNRYRIDGLWPFFCMCHPSFLIYIQIISFSFVHQSPVHYLFPIHSKYLIFFCLSISCPLSLSITFKLSHFLLFINVISIVSGTPFHLNHLIMIVSGTSIPFLSHSLSFINLMPTYSIQILILFCSSVSCPLSLSIKIILFSFVHQSLVHLFHSN